MKRNAKVDWELVSILATFIGILGIGLIAGNVIGGKNGYHQGRKEGAADARLEKAGSMEARCVNPKYVSQEDGWYRYSCSNGLVIETTRPPHEMEERP